ncbi:MAG TPA: hypothetical protein VLC08_05950, partial [Chitinolyticbacter sp.]|nr:hypothetical protein [Chitinolyticbacter sp.]
RMRSLYQHDRSAKKEPRAQRGQQQGDGDTTEESVLCTLPTRGVTLLVAVLFPVISGEFNREPVR